MDIVSLGEVLIDFTPYKIENQNKRLFEANPGGAPCNVLAAMSKLGKSTAFIGKVGADAFGFQLKETMESLHIDTSGLIVTSDYFTTLAFVTLDENGNRNFAFSRKNSADIMLTSDEVDESQVRSAQIFHCGTLSLTHPDCRAATMKALYAARNAGIPISVDPNLREPLWNNAEDAKKAIRLVLEYADIIKISDYEIEFLYGEADVVKGSKRLCREFSPKVLFATCGKDGAYLFKEDIVLHCPCFSSVKTIDTTGAGDSFCGTALSKLLDYGLDFDALDREKCADLLCYASAAASLTTAKRGAIPAMPSKEEIEALITNEKIEIK